MKAKTKQRKRDAIRKSQQQDERGLVRGSRAAQEVGHGTTADGGFPYPHGSDLHWLWGWGERIDTWLLDGKPPNRYLPGIFRPDRLADAAITRLSDRFPQAFGLIAVDLREVERCFEALDDSEGKRTELAEAMAKLRDRIWDTARLVTDADSAPAEEVERKANTMPQPDVNRPSPAKPGQVALPAQGGMPWRVAMQRAEDHVKAHDGVFPSVKLLAEIVVCSRPTIDKAVKHSPYLKARIAERKNRKAKHEVALTDATLAQTPQQTEPDPLKALVEEQQADETRDKRKQQAAKRRR